MTVLIPVAHAVPATAPVMAGMFLTWAHILPGCIWTVYPRLPSLPSRLAIAPWSHLAYYCQSQPAWTSSNASSMRLTAYLLTTRPNSPNFPARLFIWPCLLHPPPRGFSRQAEVSLSTRPVFPVAPALSFPPLLNPFPSLTSHPSCCSSTDHKWRLEKQPPAPSQRKQKQERWSLK